MQAQQSPVTVQAYFQSKRSSDRNTTIGVEGTNTMIFNDYGKAGARGIRAWEKAKFENYDQRAKQQQFYDQQRQLQQWKRRQEYEATKSVREEEERQQREKLAREQAKLREIEKLNRIVVDTSIMSEECNDAW
jgi:hypothetical protein